jgi:hypothetical protein
MALGQIQRIIAQKQLYSASDKAFSENNRNSINIKNQSFSC